VLGYASALEGLHRRCFEKSKPFPRLSNSQAGKVAAAAAKAAGEEAVKYGEDSAAVERFKDAFRHFNELTFADRIRELVQPVTAVAPGLLGAELDAWIGWLKQARNGEAHQLVKSAEDDYEEEIDQLYQLAVSGEWALRLCVLMQLGVDAELLRQGLRRHQRFHYALANMDRSRFAWPGSRLDEFRSGLASVDS
jgi:hypothetical protein